MGILESLAAWVTIGTGAAGLASVVFGAWNAKSTVQALRESLEAVRKTPEYSRSQRRRAAEKRKSADRGDQDYIEHTLEWLGYGSVIALQVRGKVLNRVGLSAIVIVVAAVAVYWDLPGDLFGIRNLEVWDVALFAPSMAVPALLRMSKLWLSDDEQVFLKNLAALRAQFYKNEVVPAIRTFNAESATYFKRAVKDYDEEIAGIQRALAELRQAVTGGSERDHPLAPGGR